MNKKLFTAFVIYVLLNPFITFGQETQKVINHPDVASNIRLVEAWIQSQIRYGKMPGVSIGIVYDGVTIYQKGFGYADVENKIPSTPDSRYRIASQSKLFTAIGIMILRDEGKLNLDDPIGKYLSWLKLKPFHESDPPVTIRQLLTHSSGISRDISSHWTDFKFPTRDEFRKLASTNLKLVYSPYSEWKYSNNAYTLLGEIIESVSGKSFDDFIKEKILLPLNMSATSVVQDKAYQSTLAVGYGRKMPDGSRQKFEYADVKATAPMSGISSSVTDLSKFVAWQMRLLYQNKTEILNPNTLREMQRVQFMDKEWRWGFGFCIYHKGEDDFIGHSGGHVGYTTNTAINTKEKIGIIVGVNSIDGEPFHGSTWSITDRMFEWLTPTIKQATTEKSQTETLQNFREFEGFYSSIHGESFVIFLDGKLKIVNPNTPDPKSGAWVLEPLSENSFKIISTPRYRAVGEILIFKRNTQGKIIGYAVGEGGDWSDKID